VRVLVVNQYFPPDATNTAYLLGELAEDLARRHETWVLAGTPSYSPEASTFRPAGVHVVRASSTAFARASMIGRVTNYLSYLGSSLVCGTRLPRPDVVVAGTDPPLAGGLGWALASRYRTAFVQIYMDIYPDVAVALGRLNGRLAVDAWRRWNGFVRSKADRIVAIGRDMVEKLLEEGVPQAKIALIPNWADEPAASSEQARVTRGKMGWDGRFIVMHAGNAGLAQGLEVLVHAASELRDRDDIGFVLVGDGAARQRLQQLARRLDVTSIDFLPHCSKAEAEAFIGAADVHLISLAPGLKGCVVPSKVYGILAAAKPFIAAVEEGSEIARLVEEDGCGIRVDPGDGRTLARVVAHLAGRPDTSMGPKGRMLFERHYRRASATAAYMDLLETVGNSRSQGQPPERERQTPGGPAAGDRRRSTALKG
jgi:putative colanic acid biosynthesis glycosyltransferase WcaI